MTRAIAIALIVIGVSDALRPASAPRGRPTLRRLSTTASVTSPQELLSAQTLAPEDEWVATLDLDAFGAEVTALGRRLESEQGDADVAHLRKMR